MRSDGALLLDMLLSAREAAAFAEGLAFPEFEGDRKTQLAILKAVETVGEAASRMQSDTTAAHPEIPWRQIVGMRNRLVHGYFDVNLRRLWETVQRDIPRLILQLEVIVPPENR